MGRNIFVITITIIVSISIIIFSFTGCGAGEDRDDADVETVAPFIVTIRPSNNSHNILPSSDLIITFNEKVIAGAGTVGIYDSNYALFEEINVKSGRVKGFDTDTITINPESNLADLTDYHVQIDATAFTDAAGNSFPGIKDKAAWTFRTADTTDPVVLKPSPADGATGVYRNTNVSITFDERVAAGAGNVSIYDSKGALIEAINVKSGQVTGTGTSNIIINPSSDFTGSTEYYVQIDSRAFDDTSGNSYAGIIDKQTWNFRTGRTVDNKDPVISDLLPADGTAGVNYNANLSIIFDEPVLIGTGNVSIYDSAGTLFEVVDVTSGQATGSGTSSIMINPSLYFIEKTKYYVQIDGSAFEDTSGNSFSGIDNKTAWNFQIVDKTPPSISTLLPADNAADVYLNSKLSVTFDEQVVADSGKISIYDSNDVLIEAIDVSGAQVLGSGRASVIIDPLIDLSGSTDYYVQIDAAAFTDSSGNSFTGIANNITWNFRTVAGATDIKAPLISAFLPVNNEINILPGSNLVITFNERAIAGTGYVSIFDSSNKLIEAIDVTGAQVTGVGTSTITVNPANTLNDLTSYYVLIDAGAFYDTARNSFKGIKDKTVWTFSTDDSTAPVISKLSPLDGATDVPSEADLIIRFDAGVVAGTGIISIYDSADTLIEAIDVTGAQVTGGCTSTIVINPSQDFNSSTDYYVQIDDGTFEDGRNNRFTGIKNSYTWNFKTADTTAPVIVTLLPADGVKGVYHNSRLSITFDEVVEFGKGNISIYDSTNKLIEAIDVTGEQVTGGGTTNIIIDPSNDFIGPIDYYVQVDAAAFIDLSGNYFTGIKDKTTWNFQTY